jgi:heavy metal efflux system protein
VIFALLFVTFGSALDAGVVLMTVPFSLAGGLIALYLRGMHLNVSAAVGFISLFGVAVMSGLLYLSEINLRQRDFGVSLRDAVVRGAQAQLRPVLMVIVVAALGMIPAMVARGIGSDIQRPLATVVVGGLISTLVLTPFALPAVYWLSQKVARPPQAGDPELAGR